MAVVSAIAASACGGSATGGADPLAGRYYAPEGVVIGGYDPVAYFTEGRPVKGQPAFIAAYDEATFWFASGENRDRFLADPPSYVPRYGGFCAYGVSEGYKATTEPDAFTVFEGRLYLNYNRDVRELWNQDRSGRIARADRQWPAIR